MKDSHRAFESVFLISEVIIAILYLLFAEFAETVHPDALLPDASGAKDAVRQYYPAFQDVHVMTYVGFGFLMVFLKTHSWTSVGYNFVISAFACQLTILVVGFWHQALHSKPEDWTLIPVDLPSLIMGDFGAITVMITFGAVLGKCSLIQLWSLAAIEIVFFGLNEAICAGELGAVDMGGSMYVHVFGAYFGCAASYFFDNRKALADRQGRCSGDYTSLLMAMVGSLFLWMYFPSANSALAAPAQQHRVIVNTVMACTGSCIAAVGISRLYLQRLNMEIVLNATMAGGISIGAASDLVVSPGLSIIIGSLGGIVSAFGILKVAPFLREKISMHDTGGAHNLHGLPGVLGGVVGAITTAVADDSFQNKANLEATFPRLAEGRTLEEQAWVQFAALCITLAIAIVGGIIAGFLASRCGKLEHLFDDQEHFEHAEYFTEVISEFKNHKREQEMMACAITEPDNDRVEINEEKKA